MYFSNTRPDAPLDPGRPISPPVPPIPESGINVLFGVIFSTSIVVINELEYPVLIETTLFNPVITSPSYGLKCGSVVILPSCPLLLFPHE